MPPGLRVIALDLVFLRSGTPVYNQQIPAGRYSCARLFIAHYTIQLAVHHGHKCQPDFDTEWDTCEVRSLERVTLYTPVC